MIIFAGLLVFYGIELLLRIALGVALKSCWDFNSLG